MTREVDAPFVSRHSEHGDVYTELVGEKNTYEQAFQADSNIELKHRDHANTLMSR